MDHVLKDLYKWRDIFEESNDQIAVECINKAIDEISKYYQIPKKPIK